MNNDIQIDNYLHRYASDILASNNIQIQKDCIQHGTTSVYEHSVSIAKTSLAIANFLNLKVDERSLVRGALLHDYFLYDWHVYDKSHRLHGFTHARSALINAKKEFKLNKIEENMILTHMFPLNLRIPKYKESILLCIVDKICATKETFNIRMFNLRKVK